MDDPEGFVEEAIDNAETVKSEDIHPMAEPAEYPEIQKKTDALKDMDESEKIELCKALERETKRCDGRVKRVACCKVVTAGGRFCIYNTLGLRATGYPAAMWSRCWRIRARCGTALHSGQTVRRWT